MIQERKVSFVVEPDEDGWVARLIQHGRPVPEGQMPNGAQALFWFGKTQDEALSKARAFLRAANAAVI